MQVIHIESSEERRSVCGKRGVRLMTLLESRHFNGKKGYICQQCYHIQNVIDNMDSQSVRLPGEGSE